MVSRMNEGWRLPLQLKGEEYDHTRGRAPAQHQHSTKDPRISSAIPVTKTVQQSKNAQDYVPLCSLLAISFSAPTRSDQLDQLLMHCGGLLANPPPLTASILTIYAICSFSPSPSGWERELTCLRTG